MLEKKICLNYNQNAKFQIEIDDSIIREMRIIERFLKLVAKHDESKVEKLLINYKKYLNKMNITSEQNKLIEQFNLDYTENKCLNKYPEYFPLIENATLNYLNFSKYESQSLKGKKIDVLFKEAIRGEFYPLYYLVYSLIELTSRDLTLEIAKEFTELSYEINQNHINKWETLEEQAKSFYIDGCPETHNFISKVKDGRYFLKITRCMWGDIYSDLPDLELASLLECYGDFCKIPYLNPNFILTRTKTLVEGYPFCDFVYHDKRIVKEIIHPEEDFWKNFK